MIIETASSICFPGVAGLVVSIKKHSRLTCCVAGNRLLLTRWERLHYPVEKPGG